MMSAKRIKFLNFPILLILVLGLCVPSHSVTASSANPTIIRVPQDVGTLHEAFANVPDGGIIEISSGTYVSPAPDGWNIGDLRKQFTVRPASGASVTLSGGGNHVILRYQNTVPLNQVKPVTFENINFANGYSATEGLAGGLTLYSAKATFVNCNFMSNQSVTSTTSGGAVFIANTSTVFFFNTTWSGNNSKVGGAAIGIRQQSAVYIHNSQFLNNNNSNVYQSSGGAINLGNSSLRVTNSRFDNNRAGAYGGAIYIIGNWTTIPRTIPTADVIVSNSVFSNNAALHDASSGVDYPTEGGAFNIEDQAHVRIYSSRFINNSANIAGGINVYRSKVEVYGSVFLGNQANDTRGTSGFGGSISLNSSDIASDGTDNKPNASLVLSNSWLQGKYGSTTTSAITGGCISVGGDNQRIENGDNIPNVGTVADNRAQLSISDSVLYECDTRPSADAKPSSAALYAAMTNLSMQNSVIASSDATTTNSMGGGMTALYNTLANINQTTLSGDTSSNFGGAIFLQGSEFHLTNSKVFENSAPTYGSAIFSAVDEGRNINMTGSVDNNVFSNNPGKYVIFDDDRDQAGVPYNDLRYNGNTFFRGSLSTNQYYDNKAGGGGAAYLNALVVNRPNRGVSTDKSPSGGNSDATSQPVLGTILAAPSFTLSNKAAGESANPASRVIYTWSGGSATYSGQSVSGIAGAASESSAGTKTLTVGSSTFTTSVTARSNPSATFNVSATTFPNYTLSWALQSGSFLDSVIDQGVTSTPGATGSVNVSAPVTTKYYLYIITQEGGFLASADTNSPLLSAPDTLMKVFAASSANKSGAVAINNIGGGSISWTANSLNPSLITVTNTSGQLTGGQSASIEFTIKASTVGTYSGKIRIQSNAGNKDVSITALVVNRVYTIQIPIVAR